MAKKKKSSGKKQRRADSKKRSRAKVEPGVRQARGRKRSVDWSAVKRAKQSLMARGLNGQAATAYLLSTGARRILALAAFRA